MEINDEYMLIISNLTVTSFVSDFDELLFVIGFAFVYVKQVRQESIVNLDSLKFRLFRSIFPSLSIGICFWELSRWLFIAVFVVFRLTTIILNK